MKKEEVYKSLVRGGGKHLYNPPFPPMLKKMDCNFSLKHYLGALELACEKGYRFFTFSDYESSKSSNAKTIFMRHDIDSDIEHIVNDFASIEHGLGIRATYFFRLTGNYNLFSPKNYRILKNLTTNGHEIGYHYDFEVFDMANPEKANEQFLASVALLELFLDREIVSAVPHLPVRTNGFVLPKELCDCTNIRFQPYSDVFFKEMKYISDSRATWKEGCMCGFIRRKVQKLHILTHPFWWYKESPIEIYSG